MSRRDSLILAPRLAGKRVHIGLGFEHGRVVEVWVDQHAVGSYGRETHHALARLATLALGAGVPVEVVAETLRGTEGGPQGVVEDCDGVESATSVADLVGRVLAAHAGAAVAVRRAAEGGQ